MTFVDPSCSIKPPMHWHGSLFDNHYATSMISERLDVFSLISDPKVLVKLLFYPSTNKSPCPKPISFNLLVPRIMFMTKSRVQVLGGTCLIDPVRSINGPDVRSKGSSTVQIREKYIGGWFFPKGIYFAYLHNFGAGYGERCVKNEWTQSLGRNLIHLPGVRSY